MAKIAKMRKEKRIASDLKAADKQLADDLNGILSVIQKKMLQTMPAYIDESADHIRKLDRNMKGEEKAAAAVQEIPGIGNTSAEATISIIGTDMSRLRIPC